MDKSLKLYKHSSSTHLEYALYGKRGDTLICFHGFGQSCSVFEDLSASLPNHQIVSISLLFHGKSDRASKIKYLRHAEWKAIFGGLLDHLSIARFSVLGYSMGGRYTTSTIHSFSERINHCFFIAPDGIVKRSSYEFATFPFGPQQIFRFFMNNPQPFFVFLDLIEKTQIINPWTIKFSRSQLKDKDQRHRVLRSWITLKYLRLKPSDLISLINLSQFKTHLIFGKYDRIIIPERHQTFFDQLKTAHISIIESPHHELIDKSIDTIKEALGANSET